MKSALRLQPFLFLFVCLAGTFLPQNASAAYDVVQFDNRSSSTLSIYRAPISSRSRPVAQLASGDEIRIKSNRSDQWIVSTPVWYRVVNSIRATGRGTDRLIIRDSDLRAIGGNPITTKFANRSGASVNAKIVVDGKELDWLRIDAGRTAQTTSFAGQDWVIRDHISGRRLQEVTTPDRASTITINPARRGDGHRGHDHGRERHDDHADESVALTITNSTPNTVAIYKKTTFGSRKVGTIMPRRSATIDTEPGAVWRVEDTVTFAVLQTIVVPDNDPHCEVAINRHAHPRPAPAPARKIEINFHNDTDEIIYIYKQKDKRWKYTKRIYAGREYRLEFYPGQKISIRDPKSGKELEKLEAPARDTTLHIESHRNHRSNPRSKVENDERPGQQQPAGPRGVLRRILFGD